MQACFLKNSDVSRSGPLGSVKSWGRKKRGEMHDAADLFFLNCCQSLSRDVCIQLIFYVHLDVVYKNQTFVWIYGRVVPAPMLPMLANMNTYMQFRHDET